MSKLFQARELLNQVTTIVKVESEERGVESDAEINCIHHVETAIDSITETIECYAGDFERQTEANRGDGA